MVRVTRLAQLLQNRLALVKTITERLSAQEKKRNTRTVVRNATYKFFCKKIDYLMRNNEISTFVGVDQNTFEQLLSICQKTESVVPHSVRIVIFLKFCQEGLSQNALSRHVGVSQPSISRIVTGCIRDLVSVAHEYIRFPTEKSEIRQMQAQFGSRLGADGETRGVPCFAVLDGKHWRCDHPPHTGSLNYNYKGFFSFNSLFLSDAESRILYIQLSALGVNSDAQLFRNGPLETLLGRAASAGGLRILPNSDFVLPVFILADNGFGSSKFVMTPYRANQLTSSEHIEFNEIISSTRVKIENLFGVLTSKFQVFARNLRLDPANSRALIVACSVIHNISIGKAAPSAPDVSNDPVLVDPYKTAETLRTALKEYLLNR